MAIQPDGKIVAGGNASHPGPPLGEHFGITRFDPDGSLDTSFDGDGIAVTRFVAVTSRINSIALQPSGKIVAAGFIEGDIQNNDPSYFALARYNADGSLDTTFGGTGKVIGGEGYANSVVLQPDGKIVAAGIGEDDGSSGFVVDRRNPDGSPDLTFGNGNGRVFTLIGEYSRASSVAIQADGKIVVAGSTNDYFDFVYFAVVRYQGGSNANIRTRFDFDGDRRADISVFRPSDSTWYLNQSTNGFSATQWGLATDRITPADFDGDGKTDISVYRDGTWYWLKSSDNSFNALQFGIASDISVPADYTGDGHAELAIYRNGVWWSFDLSNNQMNVIQFGLSTDKPVPADFDGDGRADIAIYRPASGEWWINRSGLGTIVYQFGSSTDKPVAGDYTGDGKTDAAVFRSSTGEWFVLRSEDFSYYSFPFGVATDTPAPADYDGDGKTDAAVFRDGTWYLLQSTSGISIRQFGLADDKPVPAAFLP